MRVSELAGILASCGSRPPVYQDCEKNLQEMFDVTEATRYDARLPDPKGCSRMIQDSRPSDQDHHRMLSRRGFLRSAVLLSGVAVGGSLLAACSSAAPPAAAPPAATAAAAVIKPTPAPGSGTLVYANPSKLRTLDTISVYGLQEFQISRQMMEPLLDLTQDGKLTPVLAESWTPSDGGKAWTFKLRKDVKFHDGTPFDAKSVAATVQRAKTATVSQHQFAFVDFEDPPVQIVDDYTVAFKSKTPTATLPYNLVAVYMMPAAIAADPKYDKEPFNGAIGTGPFKLTRFSVDGETRMQANPNYWQTGLPKVAELVHRPIIEPSAMVAAVKAGEVDLSEGISIDLVSTLQTDPNLQLIQSHLWQIDFFMLNSSYEPLKNPQVRQAISFAIDRGTLTKDVYGAGTPIASYPPQGLVGYDSKLPGNPYDPAKAKQLLANAGYGSGFDLEVLYPAGTYIKEKEVSQFVADQLKQVGIRARVTAGEASATRTGYREGKYQMGMLSSIAVTGDADRYFQERLVQDVYKTGYKDEQVIGLIKQAASETDPAKRQALYEQVQDLVWQGPPVIYLYQIDWTYAAKKNVNGFNWMPNRIFNLATVANRA
jgi:ABC-type transport system substrate-binding protein